MNQNTDATDYTLDEIFENLLVNKERVVSMLGITVPGTVTFEESEQNNARRELLHVEKVAITKKEKIASTEADVVKQARDHVNQLTLADIEIQLSRIGEVFSKTLGLDDNVTSLLETLSLRAATITQLEPLVAEFPWLQDELLKMVNAPKYRRKDASGKVMLVESVRTALSFVGIENLQLIFPALILRRSLPPITDPYPQIKHKLWRYAMLSALTSRELASMSGIKRVYDNYVLGMLQHLGRCAIARMYFRTFDRMHREELQRCQQEKDRKGHASLLRVTPCANYLIALQSEFSDRLTSELFEYMGFRRINLAFPMRSVYSGNLGEPDSMERVQQQSRAYAKYRMLNDEKLIDKQAAVNLLSPVGFDGNVLEKLKKLDLTHLPIEIEEPKR